MNFNTSGKRIQAKHRVLINSPEKRKLFVAFLTTQDVLYEYDEQERIVYRAESADVAERINSYLYDLIGYIK